MQAATTHRGGAPGDGGDDVEPMAVRNARDIREAMELERAGRRVRAWLAETRLDRLTRPDVGAGRERAAD